MTNEALLKIDDVEPTPWHGIKPVSRYTTDMAFPDVDPGVVPLGSKVLVQIRTPSATTKSGKIIVPDSSKDDDKYNTQVGKVRAVGPVAFHKRDDLTPWPEGAWCVVGDFVRVPKHGGDRWFRPIPGADKEEAIFLIVEDFQIVGRLTVDPTELRTFW